MRSLAVAAVALIACARPATPTAPDRPVGRSDAVLRAVPASGAEATLAQAQGVARSTPLDLAGAGVPCVAPTFATPGSYPTRYRRFDARERAEREHEIMDMGFWEDAAIDDYGFLVVARSQDLGEVPALTSTGRVPTALQSTWHLSHAEADRWVESVACHPDAFGFSESSPPSLVEKAPDAFLARQSIGEQVIGGIGVSLGVGFQPIDGSNRYRPSNPVTQRKAVWVVSLAGHFWPGARLPDATLKSGTVSARVLGQTYEVTWQPGPPPCARDAPCPMPPAVRKVVRVEAAMLSVRGEASLVRPREDAPLELRRIVRVDVGASVGVPASNAVRYSPRPGAPPLPYVVDAVTGEDLSAWQWCRVADPVCSIFEHRP